MRMSSEVDSDNRSLRSGVLLEGSTILSPENGSIAWSTPQRHRTLPDLAHDQLDFGWLMMFSQQTRSGAPFAFILDPTALWLVDGVSRYMPQTQQLSRSGAPNLFNPGAVEPGSNGACFGETYIFRAEILCHRV